MGPAIWVTPSPVEVCTSRKPSTPCLRCRAHARPAPDASSNPAIADTVGRARKRLLIQLDCIILYNSPPARIFLTGFVLSSLHSYECLKDLFRLNAAMVASSQSQLWDFNIIHSSKPHECTLQQDRLSILVNFLLSSYTIISNVASLLHYHYIHIRKQSAAQCCSCDTQQLLYWHCSRA